MHSVLSSRPIFLRRTLSLPAVLTACLLFIPGCLPLPSLQQGPGQQPSSGIRVMTHNRSTFQFNEGDWSLTSSGIRGRADIFTEDGITPARDTTLSFADVASASTGGGRGNTTEQFLKTILGVILVIGLAALILYAAFPATDR